MGRRLVRLASVVAVIVGLTAPALAQQSDDLNINEQRFNLSPHPYDYLSVMSSAVEDTFVFNTALFFNWSQDSMIFEDNAGEKDELITGKFTTDIVLSMSFFKYISFGLVFPLHLYTMTGDQNAAFVGGPIDRGEIEGFSWGDMRLSLKGRILDARESIVGVALALDIAVPTGKKDALATDDGVLVLPRLIVDFFMDGWKAALNVGYKYRPETQLRWLDVKQEFYLGFAAAAPILQDNLEALIELEVGTQLEDFFSDGNNDFLEGRLGIRWISDFGLGVTGGVGAGFLTAYGSPLYRVFAGVHYSPRNIVRDMDGDGIDDDLDGCPTEPEDADGFEDEDGCPDPDNDKDGVLDVNDACPSDPEDIDSFEDEDGCPDPDNDGDGILDVDDGCMNDAEDKDSFSDEDGCPDPDNDGDRVCDPWVTDSGLETKFAETCTGFDKCESEPENYNGCEDDDGCPEAKLVCVTEKKIVIYEKVYFKTNRATIKRESYPILDEVARVLIENPHITRIRVEGHTDSRGSDPYNLKLSKARAKSVKKYLIKAGVARKRLESEGYGETVPIAPNDTDEGRAQNRRVEFTILEQRAQ